MPDLELEDLLVAIQQCWCDALAESIGGAPATCCLVAGEPVVPDCCSGFAWVRLLSAYPVSEFPAQQGEAVRCGHGFWAAVVQVGITRCAPAACGQLGNSCCASELDSTLALLDDFRLMRRILSCCVDIPRDAVVPGAFQAVNQGACIVATMQATYRFSSGDCSC